MLSDYSFSTADNESLYRVNKMAHALDAMLDKYDKRVRPDFGGKITRTWGLSSLHPLAYSKGRGDRRSSPLARRINAKKRPVFQSSYLC